MARTIGKLTALKVRRVTRPGLYGDGGGLYLQVSKSGAKSWVYRFMLDGRAREMGLGPLHAVTLAEARARATDCRRQRSDGIDPIEARGAERAARRLDAARAMTFGKCAEAYIAAHRSGWRNPKHAAQWEATLATYAEPIIGALPVNAIDTALVTKVLEPIWTAKPETAGRVRGRIEAVLDWATVRGYRRGDNPARWRGHLDKLLPARAKVRRVEHHAALRYADMPEFMAALRGQAGTAARALELLILTAARTGEVRKATWGEFDLDARTWTVPATRTKSGREHKVPLSADALAIVEAQRGAREGDHVFPGGRKGKPLSENAMLALLRRMDRADVTPHGFRSTFRDWAAERTNYPREAAEMALAHTIGDKVEAAYRRGDLFDKRRRLMAEWARYCASPAKPEGAVVPMTPRAS